MKNSSQLLTSSSARSPVCCEWKEELFFPFSFQKLPLCYSVYGSFWAVGELSERDLFCSFLWVSYIILSIPGCELNSALNHSQILLVKYIFPQDCSALLSAKCGHFQFGKLISVLIGYRGPSQRNAENCKLGVFFQCNSIYCWGANYI